MTLAEFRQSLAEAAPSRSFDPPLLALWWMGKGNWDKAHAAVDHKDGEAAAWVHAYLHRVEGDLGNAGYWYRRAGKPVSRASLDEEWTAIATALVGGDL